MIPELEGWNIILASKSPRRQQLLKGMDIDFSIEVRETDETYPNDMEYEDIPCYLARKKADEFSKKELQENDMIITSDTMVFLGDRILEKPLDYEHAFEMLSQLSGNEHEVITGVCLKSKNKTISFHASSKVHFKELTDTEKAFYLKKYKPYDKAGSYGVQEWIGYVAIDHLEGSFYNVMGLPTHRLYEELRKFIKVDK